MTERRCDIAIIGAGTAGLHAYHAANDAGADVLVIERGDGGSLCTATGCIPSKLLIAAGRAAFEARRAGLFGVETGAVTIDGAAVMRRVRKLRDEANGKIIDEYRAIPEKHRMKGEARFAGPRTLLVGDVRVEARAVIVATGSSPEIPAPIEPVRRLVHTNETIFELERPPASLAVIGAGPLGLELAQAFARLGTTVTVFDPSGKLGKVSDPEAEACLRAALERELTLRLGEAYTAELAGDRARFAWGGEEPGSVEVDLVLAAAGRSPALEGLNLEASGAPLDEQGTPEAAPDTRRDGDSDLFVAGDAGGRRPVLHEAARGGRIAGNVAADGAGSPPLPPLAIAFTEPNIVEVGAKFDALPDGALIGAARASDNIRAEIDAHDNGIVRIYADADGTLLGGTIVLIGGEHLGQALALAIHQGLDARALADQPWYHPVIEEMLQIAARDIVNQCG